MLQQGMFEEQPSSESHWHDHEYQLDPHRLQVRETPRQQEAETAAGAQSGEEIVPRLLGEGVNKKKAPLRCCVAGCGKDLSKEKDYYQRYRVCEEHLNLSALRLADGKEHRFCQQCGRFHPLGEFDGEKKSCRWKLQEHNNRRRKRPTAQETCHDLLEHRPRRTRRTTVAGAQSENDAPAPLIRSLKVPRRQRTGPFAHLLPGERTTSGSSGAAPRSSEHASDSSTREEPRETCSSQEGGGRSADLSALRQIAATPGQHPSSQSSREESPRFLASTAVASHAAEPGIAPEDDAASHLDYMQLPDIFSTNSFPPISQASEDDLLQALYAQLGANPPPQAPASNPSHTSGPLFAESHMQPPLYAPGNANAQAASDGQAAYSQGPTHTQCPGSAQGRPDYQSLSQHLTDLDRSIQSLKKPGLVDHLEAQEVLNWQRHFRSEKEAVCKPMLPVPPLQVPPDFENHFPLDSAQQDDSMLLALSMLLDGSSTPAPSTMPLPMTGQLSLGSDFDLHPTPAHVGPLPLAGPKALSSPPHNLQRPQQLQEQLQQQLYQQQQQQQPLRLNMADGWDALQRKYAALAQSSAGTDVSGMMVQPQYSGGRQQPSAERLYHYHQYRLTPTQRVTPEHVEMQAHMLMPPPVPLSPAQDFTSALRYQQNQTASAGGYNPIDDFAFLKGLGSGLLGADKSHLQSPQAGDSSHWTNQAAVQQHALQGQHVGGMQSLQTAGMAQPAGQGVQFTNMDRHLQQERGLLDNMLYQTGPSQAPSTQPALLKPGQYMGRVNLKMLNQHPGSIPHHLLPHLSALSPEAQLTFLEGHMRPGCVHLVVDVMCTTNPAEWDVAAAAYCLMAFDAFWQHGTFLMQLPAGAVQWHDARIIKLWNASELTAAMPSLVPGTGENPMLHCVVSGQAARLQIRGRKARPATTAITKKEQSNAANVLGRYMGKFVVNPDLQECASCLQGSAGLVSTSAGEVVVPGLAGVGVLTLEAEQGSLLSAAQPVVVAPDVSTQQDVCKLVMLLQAAGLTKDAVNLLLVEIGMVLQYHEHLLEADNISNSDGVNDDAADWEGAWVDSALLSSQDSDISEFPGSDNSTHCGVLSAAASAAAHSNASSMTYMSDDDGASEADHSTYARTQHASGSPSDSLMESLWRSGSGPIGPQRLPDYTPFTHPLYVAHMVRTAKKLVGLCRVVQVPALLEQVQEVASGIQPDSAHCSPQAAAATQASYSQQSDFFHALSEPAHTSSLQSAAGAAARWFVLPTILESSIGSGTSRAASDSSRNFPLSPNGSIGLSELGFDAIELPEIVEAGPSTGDSAQSGVTSQTTDATGRTVITVVTPEEIRVLKDSAKEVHEDAGAMKAKAEEEDTVEQDAEPEADLVAQSREKASRVLKDILEGVVQRAEPYIPARLQQLVRPQADPTGAAAAQPSRLPLLVSSSKPILAALSFMMLAVLMLLGYGFHVITAASPRLTWMLASIMIMASMLRLLAVRHWAAGLKLVLNLHPNTARAYQTLLQYCRLLQHAWQLACSGEHEQWDLVQSCAASCLSLATVVITPHHLAAAWPKNVVLPGLVLLSILPASVWVVHRDWYLARRQHIQLALRICTLALLCLETAGSLWTLPWWLLIMMHPFEGAAHQQLLALAEICVVTGHAVSIVVSPAWSYWSFQGLVMLTLAFRMVARFMLHVLALNLE
ncbi:hypothetical protein WJX77_006742 [Trebouxia sp. C0004]